MRQLPKIVTGPSNAFEEVQRSQPTPIQQSRTTGMKTYGQALLTSRRKVLKDILGLGPAEIAITLVVSLVLFGPDTLKSLTKDVGKAAAELKELPQTFKEGMEEGQESTQVSKMKAIAAEKRKKRDEALGAAGGDDEDEDDDITDAEVVN